MSAPNATVSTSGSGTRSRLTHTSLDRPVRPPSAAPMPLHASSGAAAPPPLAPAFPFAFAFTFGVGTTPPPVPEPAAAALADAEEEEFAFAVSSAQRRRCLSKKASSRWISAKNFEKTGTNKPPVAFVDDAVRKSKS